MPSTVVRRTVLVALLAVAASALLAWRKQRNEMALPDGPAEWPEFVTTEPSSPMTAWVIATSDDAAPDGFPVKVKVSSGIFHLPGGRFYARTTPDRWYATADAAQADGYRQSKT
jgi:hypothetical protein